MREALAFLTPVGGARRPTPRSLRWFTLVGGGLGLVLGGLWWAARQLWPAPLAAALVVAADLGLTGMLHLDGLVDAADGLLPHLDRDRRLAVMRQPDVGAFGVGAAGAVLLVRLAALAALGPAPLLVAALWAVSRTAMAVTITRVPYARTGGGLASAFRGGELPAPLIAVALAACVVAAAVWAPLAGVASLATALIGFAAVVGIAVGRIGGFTGDVLGAAGMIAETVGLVVAAARW